MNFFRINAPAKINLGLDVVGEREDGYHEVKMVMASIGLWDKLSFRKIDRNEIKFETNLEFLPTDSSNLVVKGVNMLFEEFDIDGGCEIYLEKHIPVSAGMAGGSTDGAAALKAINKMYNLGLSTEELMDRGVKLGADVPYCIMGGFALSEGIGEKLTHLPRIEDIYILISKPPFAVSTAKVYGDLVLDENTVHPDIDGLVGKIKENDVHGMCDYMSNILEDVVRPEYKEIEELEKIMYSHGAIKSLMSGSGPTVFGLFDSEEQALAAKEEILALPYKSFSYVTGFYRN